MRLVPNQTPDKIAELFEAHVRDITPKTMEIKVTRMHGGKPWMTPYDNPFVQAAGRAIERGFGRAPVFTGEGGSIPVVSTFQEELGLPSVLFGVWAAGRERARTEREARRGQLPRRHHLVGDSLRRDFQALVSARFSKQGSNPLAGRRLMRAFPLAVLVARARAASQQQLHDAGLLLARVRRTASSSSGGLNGQVQGR